MAYVRKKSVGNREYYQLVEGKRENGRVRQRVIVHLGKHTAVEEAAVAWRAEQRRTRAEATRYEQEADTLADRSDRFLGLDIRSMHRAAQFHKTPTKILLSHILPYTDEEGYFEAEDMWTTTLKAKGRSNDYIEGFIRFLWVTHIGAANILYWRYKKYAENLRRRADKLQAKLDSLEGISL